MFDIFLREILTEVKYINPTNEELSNSVIRLLLSSMVSMFDKEEKVPGPISDILLKEKSILDFNKFDSINKSLSCV